MFSNYDEFLHFMSLQKDRVYSLDNLQAYILQCHPNYLDLPVIHVAGTNGKGSTVHYLKTVYCKSGYRVATFVSPALHLRNDIIKINDQAIPIEKMVAIANTYIDQYLEYQLSVFEIEVCIAFEYFLEQGIDLAIIEVGLGGRLDATNFVKPLVSIITNISIDHVDFLGNTLSSIAKEKAGIIKKNTPCIIGETKQECIKVIRDCCKQQDAFLLHVQELKNVTQNSYQYRDYNIQLSALGTYQKLNSSLALEVIYYLQTKYPCKKEDVEKAIYEANWPGRFEQVMDKPIIIIDGAHNDAGIKMFIESAQYYGKGTILFSAFKDKDITSMLEQLRSFSDDIILTTFDHPRAASLEDYPSSCPKEACWKQAIEDLIKTKDRIYITGSLAFISLVRAYILERGGVYTK
ncbi:bifunctional folylpolyglutamate synthase/dihydrofolate synthase [Tannockella kyphosi]|uniref:bifunctional folylpolyglutamate synthase/dihydrofolate synthase n=1 Tax=Tannockella kyphosi TaxID=2899121 RepID=UPI0020124C5B|nr:Mur ligase family protein [Tannockella kyphosi]